MGGHANAHMLTELKINDHSRNYHCHSPRMPPEVPVGLWGLWDQEDQEDQEGLGGQGAETVPLSAEGLVVPT